MSNSYTGRERQDLSDFERRVNDSIMSGRGGERLMKIAFLKSLPQESEISFSKYELAKDNYVETGFKVNDGHDGMIIRTINGAIIAVSYRLIECKAYDVFLKLTKE